MEKRKKGEVSLKALVKLRRGANAHIVEERIVVCVCLRDRW